MEILINNELISSAIVSKKIVSFLSPENPIEKIPWFPIILNPEPGEKLPAIPFSIKFL